MLTSPNLSSRGPLQTLHGNRRLTSRARGFSAHETAALRGKSRRDTDIVDIASLLKGSDSNESSVSPRRQTPSASFAPLTTPETAPPGGPATEPLSLAPSGPSSPGVGGPGGGVGFGAFGGTSSLGQLGRPVAAAQGRPGSGGGKRNMPPHTSESPAKKQSKWSPEEDALIIELRGSGMKWDDISKRLPGRSSISCRLHYQNYLERRSEWDEERKNKLARLYERFKPEMWAKVAEEMQVPWRAAEAMHWQLGEVDMARRAGVVPFSLTPAANDPPGLHRLSPSRGHGHSQSQGSLPRDIQGIPSPRYGRGHGPSPSTPLIPPPMSGGRPLAARRESVPPRPSYVIGGPDHGEHGYGLPGPAIGLAPIHTGGFSQGRNVLPSVAELTTGVSPYSTPAYSVGVPSASPVHSATASPGPYLPALSSYPPPPLHQQEPPGAKRRGSPEYPGSRESSRRRQLHPPPHHDDGRSTPQRAQQLEYEHQQQQQGRR
ncbi:MYB DNA-binding domain-containing protein [Apodospora peruviana]|uniref:MYB DNA-binding domain-containing protein n=1 Tax=Apodospora peruviana TaxID=516989 RepID=A0AAE0M197_9PEZI|nr:MYB DNA-binding domain-containing protein [Apodospora peruviana]